VERAAWTESGPSQYWNTTLKPYHERVVGAIRATGSKNVCICGTPKWSSCPNVASWNPVLLPNVAYTIHFYAAQHFGERRQVVQQALDKGVAVVCTEWGICNASGKDGYNEQSAREWMQFFEDKHISSANWAISDKGEAASALTPGAPNTGNWNPDNQLTPSGKFVRNYIRTHQEKPMAEVLMR